jgi:hypothetical protein
MAPQKCLGESLTRESPATAAAATTAAPSGWNAPCHLARRIRGECVKCGEVATPSLHIPMRTHGWWCARHCPVCNGLNVPAWKPSGGGTRGRHRQPTPCPKCGQQQPSTREAIRHCRPPRSEAELSEKIGQLTGG